MNRKEWKQRKEALKRKKYAAQVLAAYEHFEHVAKREQLERKSEVQRKNRNEF